MKKYYFTNQTSDRHNAREIELKIEQHTGLILDNPFYDGDAREAKKLDGTGQSDLLADEIVGRDLKKVRESEGIIAYMSHGSYIGSSMEIAIAAFCWGKPIYIISEVPKLKNHPWLRYFGTQIFDNVYDFIHFAKESLI